MQLMPGTAKDLNISSAAIFDPAENIGGGTQYISKLITLFKGNYDHALAGYNAGPETVRRYGGIPPYAETQNYVYLVKQYWDHFRYNGNSFPYKSFDPSLTRTAIEEKRKERFATREIGDAAKESHLIQLASGAMERADDVRHQGDYLYLASGGRIFRLNKELVVAVDGVAVERDESPSASDLANVPDATVPLPHDESVQLAAQI